MNMKNLQKKTGNLLESSGGGIMGVAYGTKDHVLNPVVITPSSFKWKFEVSTTIVGRSQSKMWPYWGFFTSSSKCNFAHWIGMGNRAVYLLVANHEDCDFKFQTRR